MTTKADAKKLTRLLLSRNPDLALVGRMIVVKPVHHLLRCIDLWRTSATHDFRPVRAIKCLCVPVKSFNLSYGNHIDRKKAPVWDKHLPNIEAEFAAQIEDDVLPTLRSVWNFDDFASYAGQNSFNHRYYEDDLPTKIIIDVARGDFAAAQQSRRRLLKVPNMWSEWPNVPEEYDRSVRILCPLIASRNVQSLAALLQVWKADTVKTFKLDQLWTPLPFPLETA